MNYIEGLTEATNDLLRMVNLRRNTPLNNEEDLDKLTGIIIMMIFALNEIKEIGSYGFSQKIELLHYVQQMEKVIENDQLSPFRLLISNGLKSYIHSL